MTRRVLTFALAILGWITLVGAVWWPVVALIVSSVDRGVAPQDGFTFSLRQMLLLWQSAWMSGLATLFAIVLSLPAALVIGQSGRLRDSAFVVAALGAVLFCPPMVYAFGWEKVLPGSFPPSVRCVGVWAFWSWPLASLVIGVGWSRSGRWSYEAASLSAGEMRAFVGAAIPSLWRHICFVAIILFILFLGEYTVPHACGQIVYATELLGWAANSTNTIDGIWPALPVVALGIVGVILVRRIACQWIDQPTPDAGACSKLAGMTTVAGTLFVVSWMVPLLELAKRGGRLHGLQKALEVYGYDMMMSLGVAAVAGLMIACVGVTVAMSPRVGGWVAMIALAWGIVPGALAGDAMVAAYNHRSLAGVYDHWPVVAICCASRFAWIGAILGLYPRAMMKSDLVSQAQTDGASQSSVESFITLPLACGTLGCAFAIATEMSVAELAATTLVRTPDYNPIALVLIEKFHRFEEEMLVALCLFLVVATIPAVVGLLLLLRRRD